MFSIAELLERAKAGGNIESDYRLAKVIGITHASISLYRVGKTLPGDKVIEQLCALSGDDAQLIFAQIQASKASSNEAKNFWEVMVKRLSGGVSTAILSVLFTIGLIAAQVDSARAGGLVAQKIEQLNKLYIVSITKLSVWAQVRLRWVSPGSLRVWCFLLQ